MKDSMVLPGRPECGADPRLTGLYRLGLLAVCVVGLACGCEARAPEYTEVRRIDEELTPGELQKWMRIVDQLPEQRLPPWPEMFPPPPQWKASRTLTIGELLKEEQAMLDDRWSVETLAAGLSQNRPLQRALAQEQLTLEQFTGLTLAVGMTVCAGTLRETQELESLVTRGEAALQELRQDQRIFSTLEEDMRFRVLQDAIWLSRVHRARLLAQVPEENLQLIAELRERILPMLPQELTSNPLDPVADILADRGLPFEELPQSGFDDQLSWNSGKAIVGYDRLSDVADPSADVTTEPPAGARAPVEAPRPGQM